MQKDSLTWMPNDRRILFKSTNFSEILLSKLGVRNISNTENKRSEKDFLLSNQFKVSTDYLAEDKPALYYNSAVVKNAILQLGQIESRNSNLYSYVYNNPINNTDPDGEIVPWLAITAVITIIAILVHQAAWYLGKFDRKKPEEPGPPLNPYRPLNPLRQGPTGLMPCGR